MDVDPEIRAMHGVREAGVSAAPASLVWTSVPGRRGGVCRLMQDEDGQCWFALAEADGGYVSVTVDAADLSRLEAALTRAKGGRDGS